MKPLGLAWDIKVARIESAMQVEKEAA
jgi:hypothetical protein